MKEAILRYLRENTYTESIYTGGGHEPVVQAFTHSKEQEREEFLSRVADEIVEEINKAV